MLLSRQQLRLCLLGTFAAPGMGMCWEIAAVGTSWGFSSPALTLLTPFLQLLVTLSQPGWDIPGRTSTGLLGGFVGFAVSPHKGDLGAALMEQKWGCSGVTDPWEGHALSHRVALSLLGFGHSN